MAKVVKVGAGKSAGKSARKSATKSAKPSRKKIAGKWVTVKPFQSTRPKTDAQKPKHDAITAPAVKTPVPKKPAAKKDPSKAPPKPKDRTIKTPQADGAGLKVRVMTARKRSLASTIWLERQLNDPYVAKSRQDGYRSRAVYKLKEMDEKYHLLAKNQRLVDLGAAPGGWSQYAAKRTGLSGEGKAGSKPATGKIVAIDLLEMDAITGVEFLQMDFQDEDAPKRLMQALGGQADGVMSDMAANATGHRQTDHLRIVALAEMAAYFACEVLAPGGFFLAKVLQGGTENTLLTMLKRDFASVHHVKPQASRADSAELYVLAKGFRTKSLRAKNARRTVDA